PRSSESAFPSERPAKSRAPSERPFASLRPGCGLRLRELLLCLARLAQSALDRAERVVDRRARLQRERAVVDLLRFGELPLSRKRVGEVVVRRRVLRVDLDRLAELGERLVGAALAAEDVAEAVVTHGARLDLQRLTIVRFGFGE